MNRKRMNNEKEEALSKLLRCAADTPPPPDCRTEVRTRISGRQETWRRAPVFAAAGVVVILGVIALLLRPMPQVEKREVLVKTPHPAVTPNIDKRVQPPIKQVKVEPEAVRPPVKKPTQARPAKQKPVAQKLMDKRPKPVPKLEDPPTTKAVAMDVPPEVQQTAPQTEPLPGETRPLALVLVTWPLRDESEDQSYSYRERNTKTGEVTTCSVRRSGNSIEIHLETTDGGDKTPPVKESRRNEPNSSV